MIIRELLLIACVSAVCGSAIADPVPNAAAPQAIPLAERPALNGTVTIPSDYTISSQDVLSIDVFGVPELSQTSLQVDSAGTIAMPFIGRVEAVGLTTTQLSQRI